MSSWDKFKETKLPPKKAFYSKLNMVGVSSENYEHPRSVWKEFKIINLGEYHDLYLKTDVILLANVFEAFREVCLKNYDLDPAHFFTAPGLAWKACLKKTKIRLELLLDPDMLLMFERGIEEELPNPSIDGLRQIILVRIRLIQMRKPVIYNISTPIIFMDGRCLNRFQLEVLNGLKLNLKKYPKESYDSHNDLPFMCKKLKISGVEKLVPNLFDKVRYVIHIRALDQALKHGLVLEKIHRAIEFD